jgi:hypothetical protein
MVLSFVAGVVADYIKNENDSDTFEHVKNYFVQKWPGCGIFYNDSWGPRLVGYCFIKRPYEHPETTTFIHPKFRRCGFSYLIRNFAINNILITGTVIYSACDKKNIPSLKSLLRSGFEIVNLTDNDGLIHLEKKISLN